MSHRPPERLRLVVSLLLSCLAAAGLALLGLHLARERAAARIELAPPFGSGMVLQRGKPLPIWGRAAPGKAITLSFAGQRKRAQVAADGSWEVELEPLAASAEGRELRVAYEPRLELALLPIGPAVIRDILVGDVWLCAGQSNMEFGCDKMEGAEAELAGADFGDIRIFLVEKAASIYPQRNLPSAGWRRATEKRLREGGWGGFSAVAFSFARRLYRETGVPLGLIQAAYGATRISAWMPREDIDSDPAFVAERRELAAVDAQYAGALKRDPKAANPYAAIKEKRDIKPSSCFNAMVAPLAPLALKGILWYQGETDMGSGMAYAEKMRAHIASWRRVFRDGGLPYYYVALPPFDYGKSEQLPELNEAQASCLDIPHTGMATIIDLGDFGDIHPRRKVEVGERLARLALHDLYGEAGLETTGPQYAACRVEGKAFRLDFSHCEGGLVSKTPGAVPGFELAGPDGIFQPASARIEGGSLLLSCPAVPTPRRARYAWTSDPKVDLFNREGLPALAFRCEAR